MARRRGRTVHGAGEDRVRPADRNRGQGCPLRRLHAADSRRQAETGALVVASAIYGVTGQTGGLKADQVYAPQVQQALTAIALHTSKYGMATADLFDMMARRGPDYLHAIVAFEEGVVRTNLERGKEL